MKQPRIHTLSEDEIKEFRGLDGLAEALHDFLEPYYPMFGTYHQTRDTGVQYIHSLLCRLPRKSAEPMAEVFGKDRKTFERFVGSNPWSDDDVRVTITQDIGHTIGGPSGVISVDPVGFPKQGTHSVGVARQWCGRLGKVENCQVGVFLNYASDKGFSLFESDLHLPKKWIGDRRLRRECHVPSYVKYRKNWEIAKDLIRDHAWKLPHARILADSEIGRCGEFRDWLSQKGEAYLLDIPSNWDVRVYQGDFLIPAPTNPLALANDPKATWRRFIFKDTSGEPLVLDARMIHVVTLRDDGTRREEILVIRKDLKSGELKFGLATYQPGVSLRSLLQDWRKRHTIEDCFQRGKSDLGMGDYEIRSWVGWHHHMTMVSLAMWFVEKQRLARAKSFFPSDLFDSHLGTPGNPDAEINNLGKTEKADICKAGTN